MDSFAPLIYKEYFPHEEIIRINNEESQKQFGEKRRPIYFGTIYVRDGRESAIVTIEGHDWSARVHGRHINRAFSGDRVAVRLLPRGHWKVQMPPALDLNYEAASAVSQPVDALNVLVAFADMPNDAQARSDTLRDLRQLLFDDGFSPSHSGWISLDTVYATVTAGFTTSHDLNQKLASSKRKITKPAGVQSFQLFTDKVPDATPPCSLSALSDDVGTSSSPKSPSSSFSFGDAFVLTGGREGPRPGEKTMLPVGEVIHVYPRTASMRLCGLIDRGAKGWGDNHVCLSSKFVYSQEHKHQSSFSSGLPDLAQLAAAYLESDDGFVISRLMGWSARQPWPIVQVTHVLCHLPLQNQLFICLAVSHGIDVPLPLTANPSDMFPFEQCELLESAKASQLAIVANDLGRIDMRDAVVFTIDSDATVDLDDAMHCRRRENGSYEVGIHIADVSRFVSEASLLDGAASQRHATQYLRVPSTFGQQPCDNTPAAAPPAASNLDAIATPISGSGAEGSVCYSSQQILRIPMLPPDVSEACSLNPNVDRYAVTVVFVVSEEGFNVEAPVLQRSIIRSAARLTFQSAQRILDCAETCDIDSAYLPKPEHCVHVRDALVALRNMSRMMQRQREVCGGGKDSGHDDSSGPKYESNDMVAEWMIRCNSTIASIMCSRRVAEHYDRFTQFVPTVKRPHPCPIVMVNEGPKDREFKMDAIRACMLECGLPELVPHHDTKSYLDAWLEQVKQKLGSERLAVVVTLPLSILQCRSCTGQVQKFLAHAPKQFLCATDSVPDSALIHWSLGLRHYTSFTSPMRKYADLTVHRQVLGMLHGNEHLVADSAGAEHVPKHGFQRDATDKQHFADRTRLLNSHDANHAAFKKAVDNMFLIVSGHSAVFTVSIDCDRSRFTVSAEIDSLRVARDMTRPAVFDDQITVFGQPVNNVKKKIVCECDSKSPAVLVLQPGSRQSALFRSGDVVMGVVSMSQAEPSTRARACVALELVHGQQKQPQLAMLQQYVCKHDDVATLRQHVEAVAFGDMDKSVKVLADCKGNIFVFGDQDRKKKCEQFKFTCNPVLPSHFAIERAKHGMQALNEAVWTLSCDQDGAGTLRIFNCRYPLDASHPETREFREIIESDLRQCFDSAAQAQHSPSGDIAAGLAAVRLDESHNGTRALVVCGIPPSFSDEFVVSAIDSFFPSFALENDADTSKITMDLIVPCVISDALRDALILHLGMVFAWKPRVFKWLVDEKNLLSGMMLTDVPVSCAHADSENFKQAFSQFSGIKSIKIQENSKDKSQAVATISLQKPFKSKDESYHLDHIVARFKVQDAALPIFHRNVELEFIENYKAAGSRGPSVSPPPVTAPPPRFLHQPAARSASVSPTPPANLLPIHIGNGPSGTAPA